MPELPDDKERGQAERDVAIADRIRDVAQKHRDWNGTREPEDKEIYDAMLAIASEIEEKAEEMRRESSGSIRYMDKWADSLARRKE